MPPRIPPGWIEKAAKNPFVKKLVKAAVKRVVKHYCKECEDHKNHSVHEDEHGNDLPFCQSCGAHN